MTADEAAAMRAAGALAGRREAALLGDPSVVRTAALLAARCPSPAWVRAAVTTLDRFAQTIPDGDLSRLLDRLRSRPSDADACLYQYPNALNGYADTQIAWLAFGPKLWLATNGVGLAWRPLPARTTSLTRTVATGTRRGHIADAPARLLLLLLVGSGLTAEEAVRLRLGDLGHVDKDCALVPDLFAEPLSVRYSPTEPGQIPETGAGPDLPGLRSSGGAASRPGAPSRSRRADQRGDPDPGSRRRGGRNGARPVATLSVDRGRQRRQRGELPCHRPLLPPMGHARSRVRSSSISTIRQLTQEGSHEGRTTARVPREASAGGRARARADRAQRRHCQDRRRVCRTDLHIWEGQFAERQQAANRPLPYSPGHENAGWVEAVGSAVANVAPGNAVILHPLITCGLCLHCRAGNDMHCDNGVFPGLLPTAASPS